MFNPKDSATVDQSAHDDTGFQFPLIQWANGSPQMKAAGGIGWTGGWFANGDDFDFAGEEGWAEYELVHRNQSSTSGWSANVLTLSVIRKRQRWEAYAESGPRKVWSWNQYELARSEGFRPRARTHLLAYVRGLVEPVVITLPGTIGKYVLAEQQKFRKTVIAAANKASLEAGAPASWQPWHFWMPLGAPLVKGEPKFTTVGQGNATSQITTPVLWGIPASITDVGSELLNKLYVGSESVQATDAFWHESQSWQEEWESQEFIQAQENKWAEEKVQDAQPQMDLKDDVNFDTTDEVEEIPW